MTTIFVQDPHFRITLDQIKKHVVFKVSQKNSNVLSDYSFCQKIDWDEAKNRKLPPPFVPDDAFAYHNCNERA